MKDEQIDLLIEALTELKAAKARVSDLEERILSLVGTSDEKTKGVLPLIADFSEGTFTTKEVASELGMTPQYLNKVLSHKGVLVRYGDKWIVAPKYAPMGLMCVRVSPYTDSSSPNREKVNLLIEWTKRGKDYIIGLFK